MARKTVSVMLVSSIVLVLTLLNVVLANFDVKRDIENQRFVLEGPKVIWVPDNYTKIQWAIGNASEWDTIFVKAGTYYEQVTIDKPLTLIGENPSTTIIDGSFVGAYVIKCNASHVNISGFTIQHGIPGIDLNYCSNVTISGNIITDNSGYGVFLLYSSNNTIHSNTVSNNGDRGIYLRNHSSNNTVSNNTISNHKEWGIYLFNYSSNNIISSNTILYSGDRGIYLINADNNVFNGNTVSNNPYGISIRTSAGNTLRNNNMSDNTYNFDISAVALGQYIQDIDPSNTVNGKPIYYWVNQANKQVPAGAGYVAVINSKNITIKNQTLTNNAQGVLFAYTTNSTIVNVNASYNNIGIHIIEDLYIPPKAGNNIIKDNILANNYEGIEFRFSSDNTFTGNTVTKNYYGVNSAFCNNTLYHNNFIDNINLTYRNISLSIINIWDNGYPSGGNYWSDHVCTGNPSNGSQPYIIDADNIDHYPFQDPNGWLLPHGPMASFINYPSTPFIGQSVTFDASISLLGWNGTHDIPIANYTWDFDDGNITTVMEPVINHAYITEGICTVSLTIMCEDDLVLIAEGLTSDATYKTITIDGTPPSIGAPFQEPEKPLPDQKVVVFVNVTDYLSEVREVILSYSNDSGTTWANATMNKTTGDTYVGGIPEFPLGTHIWYKIIAYDNANNSATRDNAGAYYVYMVIPEFPSAKILLLSLIVLMVTIVYLTKGKLKLKGRVYTLYLVSLKVS